MTSRRVVVRRTSAQWEELIRQWEASGQTQREFARSRGINVKTFEGQMCRTRKRQQENGSGKRDATFVEVATSTETPSKIGMQIRVTRTDIDFAAQPGAQWLAELIARVSSVR